MNRARHPVARLVGLLAGLVGLVGLVAAGCRGAPAADAERPAPPGVSVEIKQFRSDQTAGRVQLGVTVAGAETLVVEQALLVSPRFTGQPGWRQRDPGDAVTIRPRLTVDLPAVLTPPACPVRPVAGPAVRLLLRDPAGDHAWVRLAATDPADVLARVQRSTCLRVAAQAVATLTLAPLELPHRGKGTVVVRLVPTGRPGELAVRSMGSTTLLTPAGPVTATVSAATGPVELRVPVRPTRCDPHAIAEDKVGALLPFTVAITGPAPAEGVISLPPGEEFRASVYAFVQAACRTTQGAAVG